MQKEDAIVNESTAFIRTADMGDINDLIYAGAQLIIEWLKIERPLGISIKVPQ